MNTFAQAINSQTIRTANGMKTLNSSADACTDLFFEIGASRGKDIIPKFVAAYAQDRELALRIAQWARDPRGGSGERELFRSILRYLEKNQPEDALALLPKIPEIGRWDDLFVFKSKELKEQAYVMLGDALRDRNGLAAKWAPREKSADAVIAKEIREFYGMTPKQYRKSLVALTNVVETSMCANDWDNINFSHVPSLAHARYKKAFSRHGSAYATYVAKLASGDASVKINATAVYPYDVLKGAIGHRASSMSKVELDAMEAQWAALPNYVGSANVLPMIDSSASMTCSAGGSQSKSDLTCLEVAISLGLYFADKNEGKFADCFLTFSNRPKLVNLKGTIAQKIVQMNTGEVANTNLNAAFDLILSTAISNGVPQEEMPETLLIFSDMQFDGAVDGRDESAIEMMTRKYVAAGYTLPKVVFWNLNASSQSPVKFDKSGTALVSGFSPAIATSVLKADIDNFTPRSVMLDAVMKSKYDI